MILIGDDK